MFLLLVLTNLFSSITLALPAVALVALEAQIASFLIEKASSPSRVTKNKREKPKIFEYFIFNLSSCSHLKIVQVASAQLAMLVAAML